MLGATQAAQAETPSVTHTHDVTAAALQPLHAHAQRLDVELAIDRAGTERKRLATQKTFALTIGETHTGSDLTRTAAPQGLCHAELGGARMGLGIQYRELLFNEFGTISPIASGEFSAIAVQGRTESHIQIAQTSGLADGEIEFVTPPEQIAHAGLDRATHTASGRRAVIGDAQAGAVLRTFFYFDLQHMQAGLAARLELGLEILHHLFEEQQTQIVVQAINIKRHTETGPNACAQIVGVDAFGADHVDVFQPRFDHFDMQAAGADVLIGNDGPRGTKAGAAIGLVDAPAQGLQIVIGNGAAGVVASDGIERRRWDDGVAADHDTTESGGGRRHGSRLGKHSGTDQGSQQHADQLCTLHQDRGLAPMHGYNPGFGVGTDATRLALSELSRNC